MRGFSASPITHDTIYHFAGYSNTSVILFHDKASCISYTLGSANQPAEISDVSTASDLVRYNIPFTTDFPDKNKPKKISTGEPCFEWDEPLLAVYYPNSHILTIMTKEYEQVSGQQLGQNAAKSTLASVIPSPTPGPVAKATVVVQATPAPTPELDASSNNVAAFADMLKQAFDATQNKQSVEQFMGNFARDLAKIKKVPDSGNSNNAWNDYRNEQVDRDLQDAQDARNRLSEGLDRIQRDNEEQAQREREQRQRDQQSQYLEQQQRNQRNGH